MKELSEDQLNKKIDAFLGKKLEQHQLRSVDGARAGKLWHINPIAKQTWRLIDGHRT